VNIESIIPLTQLAKSMSNFSGAVKLADLNDFIAPSQACVVNLETLKDKPLVSDFEVRLLLQLEMHICATTAMPIAQCQVCHQ
jgi:hypothetical protein